MSHSNPRPPAQPRSFGPAVFRLAALSNWLVTIVAIVAPEPGASLIGLTLDSQHVFLFRIWAGMAFLWGVMFFEIAGDMDGRKRMIKYAWLEKTVTALSVTIAFARNEIPATTMWFVLYTDHFWIPFFLYYWARTKGNPSAEAQLARARETLAL